MGVLRQTRWRVGVGSGTGDSGWEANGRCESGVPPTWEVSSSREDPFRRGPEDLFFLRRRRRLEGPWSTF